MLNFLASKATCWLLITLCWFMHFLCWFSSKKNHSLLPLSLSLSLSSNLCMSLFLFFSSFAVTVLHSSHPTNFDLTSPFILFYAAFIYTYYKLFTLCCKLYPYPLVYWPSCCRSLEVAGLVIQCSSPGLITIVRPSGIQDPLHFLPTPFFHYQSFGNINVIMWHSVGPIILLTLQNPSTLQ